MSAREVVLVRTGVANTASVLAALERAGATVRDARDGEDALAAERLLVPGVGAFAAGREALASRGLDEALGQRVAEDRPTLGICLGFQLFCEGSEEAPDVPGLGAVAGRLGAFGEDVCRPQMGWNAVTPDEGARWIRPGHVWFANSYRLERAPEGWSAAWSDHGGRFVAGLERGEVLLCQFHPELSGAWGADLLARWIAGGAAC